MTKKVYVFTNISASEPTSIIIPTEFFEIKNPDESKESKEPTQTPPIEMYLNQAYLDSIKEENRELFDRLSSLLGSGEVNQSEHDGGYRKITISNPTAIRPFISLVLKYLEQLELGALCCNTNLPKAYGFTGSIENLHEQIRQELHDNEIYYAFRTHYWNHYSLIESYLLSMLQSGNFLIENFNEICEFVPFIISEEFINHLTPFLRSDAIDFTFIICPLKLLFDETAPKYSPEIKLAATTALLVSLNKLPSDRCNEATQEMAKYFIKELVWLVTLKLDDEKLSDYQQRAESIFNFSRGLADGYFKKSVVTTIVSLICTGEEALANELDLNNVSHDDIDKIISLYDEIRKSFENTGVNTKEIFAITDGNLLERLRFIALDDNQLVKLVDMASSEKIEDKKIKIYESALRILFKKDSKDKYVLLFIKLIVNELCGKSIPHIARSNTDNIAASNVDEVIQLCGEVRQFIAKTDVNFKDVFADIDHDLLASLQFTLLAHHQAMALMRAADDEKSEDAKIEKYELALRVLSQKDNKDEAELLLIKELINLLCGKAVPRPTHGNTHNITASNVDEVIQLCGEVRQFIAKTGVNFEDVFANIDHDLLASLQFTLSAHHQAMLLMNAAAAEDEKAEDKKIEKYQLALRILSRKDNKAADEQKITDSLVNMLCGDYSPTFSYGKNHKVHAGNIEQILSLCREIRELRLQDYKKFQALKDLTECTFSPEIEERLKSQNEPSNASAVAPATSPTEISARSGFLGNANQAGSLDSDDDDDELAPASGDSPAPSFQP
jgi:hypothetical protein